LILSFGSAQTLIKCLRILRVSSRSHAQNNDQIVIQCPSGNANLNITDIQIELKDDAGSHQALSTWIWRKQVWMQFSNSWLDWAQSIGLTKAYIQIDIEDDAIADEKSLATYIADARKKGIDVFAVEGDPQMIGGDGQKSALRRTQIIKNFQNSLPENAKLAGIQYDIEPYSVPTLNANPTKMWADWSSTLTAMQKIWDAPIDIVVPYWLQNTSEAMHLFPKMVFFGKAIKIMHHPFQLLFQPIMKKKQL